VWLRRDELNSKLREEEIQDWVEIDGIVWVEIPNEKGALYVQPDIKRGSGKDVIPVEACLEEAHD